MPENLCFFLVKKNDKKNIILGNFYFLTKKGRFSGVISSFYGQRSVTAVWATPSPCSILSLCLSELVDFDQVRSGLLLVLGSGSELPPSLLGSGHFRFWILDKSCWTVGEEGFWLTERPQGGLKVWELKSRKLERGKMERGLVARRLTGKCLISRGLVFEGLVTGMKEEGREVSGK